MEWIRYSKALYFLKRFSKAARASRGFEEEVSRSRVVRGAKNEQWLRASFLGIRAVMGFVHSKRLAVSKNEHCLQLWSSAPHRGHLPSTSTCEGRIAAQEAHRQTERCAGIAGVRGPKVSGLLAGRSLRSSRPESIYPFCLYFLPTEPLSVNANYGLEDDYSAPPE